MIYPLVGTALHAVVNQGYPVKNRVVGEVRKDPHQLMHHLDEHAKVLV